jgi:hypothetical protein
MDESEEMSRVNGWTALVDSRAFNQRPGLAHGERKRAEHHDKSELAAAAWSNIPISLNSSNSKGVRVLLLFVWEIYI